MNCPKCGIVISPDIKTCPICGLDMESYNKKATIEEAAIDENATKTSGQADQTEPKKSRKYKIIVAVSSAAVVVAIALIVVFTVMGINGNVNGKIDYQAMNLNNGGDFVYTDNALYYVTKDTDGKKDEFDVAESCIVKSNLDGSDVQKIVGMNYTYCLNIYDGKLYFKHTDNKKSVIYCTDLDGKNQKVLFEKDKENVVTDLSVVNDKLYYIINNKLYSRDLDGKNEQQVIDGRVESYLVSENAIFYSANKQTMMYRDGKVTQLAHLSARSFNEYNGYLYFVNIAGGLNRVQVREDGVGNLETVTKDDVSFYAFNNNKVYYIKPFTQDDTSKMADMLNGTYEAQKAGSVANSALYYRMLLLEAGELYRVNLNGTDQTRAIKDTNMVKTLYFTPRQMLYTIKYMDTPTQLVVDN